MVCACWGLQLWCCAGCGVSLSLLPRVPAGVVAWCALAQGVAPLANAPITALGGSEACRASLRFETHVALHGCWSEAQLLVWGGV